VICTCDQVEAQRISMLREKGYPYKTIAGITGRGEHQVRRYHRLFDTYGIDFFAEKPLREMASEAREAREKLHTGGAANEPGAKASATRKPARANRKATQGASEVDMGERVTA